jgi:general secretion pathway protein G
MLRALKAQLIQKGSRGHSGFTLLELVITLTVLAILVMGTLPVAQNAIKREKEMRLRETLRIVRNAIDEFRRDTNGACPAGAGPQGGSGGIIIGNNPTASVPADPRSRVVIDDCTIFDTQNLDRYPPTIETLVDGVQVRQRGINLTGGRGLNGNNTNATEINGDEDQKKVYLREMPVDPMTGKSDWKIRSSYQDKDSDTWDEINVFDIRSASDDTALNGEKYSDW